MELGTGNKEPGREPVIRTLRGMRKVGRRPSRFAPWLTMLAGLLPPLQRRARVRSRLEQIQTLRRLNRIGEDAP